MLHLSAVRPKALAAAAGGLIVVSAVAACASNGPQAPARTQRTAGTSPAATASSSGTSPTGSAVRTAPTTGRTGPNVTRCTAATLTLAEGNHFGAGGHIFTAYVFTNAGTTTCDLYGYPGLQFAGHDGKPIPTTERRSAAYTFPAVLPRTVVLLRGAKASFSVEVLDNPQTGEGETTCPRATAVEVIPPNGYRQLSAPFGPSPVCGFGAVTVSPVVPGDQGIPTTAPSAKAVPLADTVPPAAIGNRARRSGQEQTSGGAAGWPVLIWREFHGLRLGARRAGLPRHERGAGAEPAAPRAAPLLTARAAMAYLHGSDERQQVIADALSSRAAAEMNRPGTRPSGTQRARRRGRAS